MVVEPGPEQRRDLMRQADGKVEAGPRAGRRPGFDDAFHLMIGDLRHYGGDGDVARDAGIVERLDRGEPLARLRRPRLKRARDL